MKYGDMPIFTTVVVSQFEFSKLTFEALITVGFPVNEKNSNNRTTLLN